MKIFLGLVYYHNKGFPYGAKQGEEERVSLENAAYTQGNFKVQFTGIPIYLHDKTTLLFATHIICL